MLLIFSGHMVDETGRMHARFPSDKVSAASARIDDALSGLDAGPADLGITQGAAGGDLLFGEACVRRGVPLRLLLPLAEPEFIEGSIIGSSDGPSWEQRYVALRSRLQAPPDVMPDSGPRDPFEACNHWILDTALASDAEALQLICLWNGEPADKPGGTAHMVSQVQRAGGHAIWIDTRTL